MYFRTRKQTNIITTKITTSCGTDYPVHQSTQQEDRILLVPYQNHRKTAEEVLATTTDRTGATMHHIPYC